MLIYPNTYFVGMSNLGFQTIYKILNEDENILCERAFLENDYEKPKSLENGRFAIEFDAIIFSISFEIDFLNVIKFLKLSGFPLKNKERYNMPPVAAGGIAVTLNCKPLLNITDYLLLGDGEDLILAFADSLFSKDKFFKIEGVVDCKRRNITQASVYRGDKICHSVISTEYTEFSNRFLVEIARGCPYKCNFCAVAHNYKPYRIHKLKSIKEVIEEYSEIFQNVGIVGASVTSHPEFLDLCKWLNIKSIPFSITSLRLDTVSSELLDELVQGGNNTFAVAVEACSETLRKKINKNLTDEQIFNAIDKFIEKKIINLRIYIMVGLPFEEFCDIENIVRFVERVKKQYMIRRKELKRFGSLTISVNPFIPKPNTPFYTYKMEKEDLLRKKIKYLSKNLNKIPNVKMVYEDIYRAYMQGLLSKGDEKLTDYLIDKAINNISNKRFFTKHIALFKQYNVI